MTFPLIRRCFTVGVTSLRSSNRRARIETWGGQGEGIAVPAWFSLPSLHHPPDRKAMHEATKEKRSGESASSHLETITCLIRDHQCLIKGHGVIVPGLLICSQGRRGRPRTLLRSHYVGNVHSFPLIQLWLLKNETHSMRSFYLKTSRGQISWWLFQTEKRGHAHTYARTDHWRGREGECFPHYCIRGAADELQLKITERKRQERGDHAGITNDIYRGGVTTAEILCGGLYKIFTLCQSDELIQIRGKNSWLWIVEFLFIQPKFSSPLLTSHTGFGCGGVGGGGGVCVWWWWGGIGLSKFAEFWCIPSRKSEADTDIGSAIFTGSSWPLWMWSKRL